MSGVVWICVRCKCTSETRLGAWFMQDRDSSHGLCQECIDSVLADWLTEHGKTTLDIGSIVKGGGTRSIKP